MSREKELVKNTFVLSIGKFLPKLIALIVLPILTANLSKREYGTYDLITTLVMLVIPITTLQIQSAAFRFLIDCRGDHERSSRIISNIFYITIPISLIASIVIQFFFSEWDVGIRILIATYFFFDTIHLTVGQITRGLGFNKLFSIGSIILSMISMLTIVVTVYWLKSGLLGVTLAMVLAQIISTLFLIKKVNLISYLSMRQVSRKCVRELLAYSWPMVPNNLSTWILKLSDRLIIIGFISVEANAIYAVANKIPNLLSIAQSIMVTAWQENASIAAKDKDADQYYSTMLERVFKLMFGCTILLIAATPIMFKLLIHGDYSEAYCQIPLLIVAMFFFTISSYFGGIYIAHKKTVSVGITTMIAALINIVIDLALIKAIGIWAGSISTLVSYFAIYLFRMINCQSFQKIKVNYAQHVLLILIMFAFLVSCFMQKTYLDIINIVAAILIFLAFNKELVKNVLQAFRKKRKGCAK